MLKNFNAFQLAKAFYKKCKLLKCPKYLSDQLLRASSSVALNLAEGSGKRTPADQKRFYSIALGSLRECEAILELEELGDDDLRKLVDRLGAILFTLSKKPLNRTVTETETETATDL